MRKSKAQFSLVVAKEEVVYPEDETKAPYVEYSWRYNTKEGGQKTFKQKAYIPEEDRRGPDADHSDVIDRFRSKANREWGKKAATLL